MIAILRLDEGVDGGLNFGVTVERGRGAQFDDEFGADWFVLFCADSALMLLDNLGSDSEAKACAALLGGEVREEEALAHLVGEAGTGGGDGEFDHTVFEKIGGDGKLAK